LKAKLDVIVSRKLGYPYNPEAGFGAVAEDGSTFMFDYARGELPKATIDAVLEEQKREAKRRVKVLRGGRPLPDIRGKTIILVDDGIAMGSTMRASIMLCKKRGAKRIVVAVPVSGEDTAREIANEVDELVVLEKPAFFQAVAQVYENWYDVPDDEVIRIMAKASR
jgi:predicted phosphoribosyltransferase